MSQSLSAPPSQGRCSMQPTHLLMIAATTLVLSSTSVFADTKTGFDPLLMRECP